VATEKGTSSRTSTQKTSRTRSDGAAAKPSPRSSAPRAEGSKKLSGSQVAASATRQLLELAGREAESVTGLRKTEDGWQVQVEVVEVRRIPDTTDILALYEIDADSSGQMEGYRRVRRYVRGVPGED
jgi:hypothetical protein